MATTPSNSGGDDDDDRESVGSGGDEVEEEEGEEEEQEGVDSENEEGEGGDEEEEEEGEGGDGDEEEEEAEDFGSQRPEVLKKKPLPEDEDEEAAEGDGEASSEEDEVPPTHDARKTAAAPPVTPPPPAAKPAATPPPAPVKKKAGSLSQATLVSKLKPTKDRDGKSTEAQADASKGPPDASRPRGGKAATKPKPAPAASSGASTASTASAKPNGKQKASSTSTTKSKGAPKAAPSGAGGGAAAKRFEQSDDEEDGVSGEEAEAEASLNRPGEGLAERRPPASLQDTHPDVHMEADAAREREAANTREPASRLSGPPAKKVIARVDPAAWQQTAVFKAVGLAHRWYKHAHQAVVHQLTEGHEGDAMPFEVRFVDYVDKGNNNRAAVQKQLLEAQPEKFLALMRIAGASATTGGYADNLYHASIPITVVDDDSSPDLIRKFKDSKPPDSALGSNPRVHWPLEPKVVESAYLEPNCPLPSHLNPKNVPKDDPKSGPKFVLIPGQNQIPNMEEWTHVSASAGTKRPKGGIEGSKRQKTNQATLPFGAAAAAAEAGAPAAPAVAAAAASSSSGAAGSSSDAAGGQADDPPYKKCHIIPVASAEKTTMSIVPGSNSVVIFEW